jgi:hypothetical protein
MISAWIEAGEIYGLVGSDGGKTHCVCWWGSKADAGQVSINVFDISPDRTGAPSSATCRSVSL